MARHIWSVLCESSIIDSLTNRMSLFNAVEQIGVTVPLEEWPVEIPLRFDLVTMWSRFDFEVAEESLARIIVDHTDEIDEVDEVESYSINLTGDFKRFRHQTRFFGVRVMRPGVTWFIVQQLRGDEWAEVSRIPLEVRFQPELEKQT